VAAGNGEILGAMDAGCRNEADTNGNEQVENDEPDQHDRPVDDGKRLKTLEL
jgi:hypothetical protein